MKINPLTDRHYMNEASDTLTNYYPVEEAIYGARAVRISEEEAMRILRESPRPCEIPKAEQSGAFVPGGSTPSQYALPEGATELQDLIEAKGMNFAMGNIFKAAYRYGNCSHSDKKRDLNKILWFANRELKRLDNEL